MFIAKLSSFSLFLALIPQGPSCLLARRLGEHSDAVETDTTKDGTVVKEFLGDALALDNGATSDNEPPILLGDPPSHHSKETVHGHHHHRNHNHKRDLNVCEDDPEGWYDADGPFYDCAWYAKGNNCNAYGHAYRNDGKTAKEACCVCGGGKQSFTSGGGGNDGGNDGEDGGGSNNNNENCPPADQMTQDAENRVLELVNEARAAGVKCGSQNMPAVAPLTMSTELSCAARFHSKWMADNDEFSHNSPGGALGENAGERMTNSGYSWNSWGENIAAGYGTAEKVMDGWLKSTGHCKNIMKANFKEIGVGLYTDDSTTYGLYWTQNFARPA